MIFDIPIPQNGAMADYGLMITTNVGLSMLVLCTKTDPSVSLSSNFEIPIEDEHRKP
jgi:hypothetical protein